MICASAALLLHSVYRAGCAGSLGCECYPFCSANWWRGKLLSRCGQQPVPNAAKVPLDGAQMPRSTSTGAATYMPPIAPNKGNRDFDMQSMEGVTLPRTVAVS